MLKIGDKFFCLLFVSKSQMKANSQKIAASQIYLKPFRIFILNSASSTAPLDYTVSDDAGIQPRTVATLALPVSNACLVSTYTTTDKIKDYHLHRGNLFQCYTPTPYPSALKHHQLTHANTEPYNDNLDTFLSQLTSPFSH